MLNRIISDQFIDDRLTQFLNILSNKDPQTQINNKEPSLSIHFKITNVE